MAQLRITDYLTPEDDFASVPDWSIALLEEQLDSHHTVAGRAPRLLVIEDEDDIRALLCKAAQRRGYEVVSASNGAAALALLEQGQVAQPDVILLDMWMPIMDGWTFLRLYRELPLLHAPVIAVTASYPEDLTLGIDAHSVIAKPFELPKLLELIDQFTGNAVAAA